MKNLYAVAGVGLAVAALVFVAIFVALPEPDRVSLLSEVATAAIGFFPVVFFSVIVASLVHRRDTENARREQRFEARRAFRLRAISAYNESKATRRILRGSGLRPDSEATLTDDDLRMLDEQMRSLVVAQLTMEQLKREVCSPAAPFDDREHLRLLLEKIEKYLNRVIKDWEVGRPSLRVGAPVTDLGAWEHFADFVADKDASRLPDNPTAAFSDLEEAVLRELANA